MSRESTEAFRGHVVECFMDLVSKLEHAHPKGSKGAQQARKPIADFCDVSVSSVGRWNRNPDAMPVGGVLIKLICYLNLMGYKVIELERMVTGPRAFMEIVGFGLLTIDEAATVLDYARTSTLYQVLLGHQGTSPDRAQKMWEEWKTRKSALDAAKDAARKRYWLPALGDIPVTTPTRIRSRYQNTLRIMEGLLGMLEEDPLGSLSQDAIRRLPLEDVQIIFRLSGAMSGMSAQVLLDRKQPNEGGEER